ncbi:Multiple glycosyl transferase domain and TPR domain protein [Rhodococcus sp. AW25M09]|uniref:glycosyltransferase n=1 Tax=Rhodococcus sp. AW25M09 TaxID=1268303 RepID=UPI0002AC4F5C|nr:glycosyltransferase family A protein [Rhodococcus sp. AW25M09]CCQ17286.1 Multiple glycosyl transferase domain and TPR domain protein [Rhodococcus sp. AW25M09]
MIIPVHNAKDLLGEQLHALAQQDYDGTFTVIISDNGSTDGVREYVENHDLSRCLNLQYVDSSGTAGASFARNRGAEAAHAPLLAFCDADDVVHPTWLRRITAELDHHDLVGTGLSTEALNSAETREVVPFAPPSNQGRSPFRPFVIGASMACRASTYRDLGGMLEFVHASEDMEFSWRALQAGARLHFIAEPLVEYRLRTGYLDNWRQAGALGYGSAHVRGMYRAAGCPPFRIRTTALALLALALRNPLLPTALTHMPTRLWLRLTSAHLRLIRGGRRYRSLTW